MVKDGDYITSMILADVVSKINDSLQKVGARPIEAPERAQTTMLANKRASLGE